MTLTSLPSLHLASPTSAGATQLFPPLARTCVSRDHNPKHCSAAVTLWSGVLTQPVTAPLDHTRCGAAPGLHLHIVNPMQVGGGCRSCVCALLLSVCDRAITASPCELRDVCCAYTSNSR